MFKKKKRTSQKNTYNIFIKALAHFNHIKKPTLQTLLKQLKVIIIIYIRIILAKLWLIGKLILSFLIFKNC